MVTKSKILTFEETDSVLEAIILESNLIKQWQPQYNVMERDDKSSQYVIITDEPWPRVFQVRARDFDQDVSNKRLPYKVRHVFGPFPYGALIKDALKILRKIFPFKDEKSLDPRHDRFYKSIGRSPSSDVMSSMDVASYTETILYLTMFFEGKKREILRALTAKMNGEAEAFEFERAEETKKLIYALQHINDFALIKRDRTDFSSVGAAGSKPSGFRMEAYDVAHMSGKNTVGVMVVSKDGEFDKSQYRKFKIKTDANNDPASLAELLLRRLDHSEWPYPDLIVLDGGSIQEKVATSVLKSRRLNIPIVAVTKDDRHKASKLIGNKLLITKYSNHIIAINAESHRFAVNYHRKRRSMNMLRLRNGPS